MDITLFLILVTVLDGGNSALVIGFWLRPIQTEALKTGFLKAFWSLKIGLYY